jgi:hypothetical protein
VRNRCSDGCVLAVEAQSQANRCESGAVGGETGAESVRLGRKVVRNRMGLGLGGLNRI